MTRTRTQFRDELHGLRDKLLEMGSEADSSVGRAIQALTERSVAIAEGVISGDDRIDSLDIDIEQECMKLIALQQPMARDLRLIGTVMKVITDLERIGDHAVDIAKVARKLADDPIQKEVVDIPRMADVVRRMLRDAMTAFVNHDLDLVQRVIASDDEVDRLFHEIRSDLHNAMRQDPEVVVQCSYLLFVAHYLERIADHTVNIAEREHFVETGELAQLAASHKSSS